MAKKIRRKPQPKRRRSRYTPAEWFMVLLGGAIVVLIAGLIITTLLGG